MVDERVILEVHRAPMRSRNDAIDQVAAVAWALRRGIVGVGGVLEESTSDPEEAVEALRAEQGDRMADRLRRFVEVEISSFVWTRTDAHGFRLGRVHGPWAYDASAEAARADLPHTRACRWADVEVAPVDVPADVVATFERGGRNFQRIRSRAAERATLVLWDSLPDLGGRA